MEYEIIKKAINLFDSPEKWNAFLELANLQQKITNQWNSDLLDAIRSRLTINDDRWDFRKNGWQGQWFLYEFGHESLSLWLELGYFSLWANPNLFDVDFIEKKLKEPEFRLIHDAMPFKDRGRHGGYIFSEIGRFEFGNIYDNHFDWPKLSWFAGNNMDDFIKQIELKLKPFIQSNSTDLLVELNRLAKR